MKRLLIILPVLLLTGCSSNKWTGFYYPNGTGGTTIYSYVDQFQNYEECNIWVNMQNRKYSNPESADWECGKSCKLSKDSEYLLKHSPETAKKLGPMYVCKETM
jgi:hypothetical protein